MRPTSFIWDDLRESHFLLLVKWLCSRMKEIEGDAPSGSANRTAKAIGNTNQNPKVLSIDGVGPCLTKARAGITTRLRGSWHKGQ